jgi:surface protein
VVLRSCCGRGQFGYISKSDVSRVTSMKELFYEKDEFNEDISAWDVSSVTNMLFMSVIYGSQSTPPW